MVPGRRTQPLHHGRARLGADRGFNRAGRGVDLRDSADLRHRHLTLCAIVSQHAGTMKDREAAGEVTMPAHLGFEVMAAVLIRRDR